MDRVKIAQATAKVVAAEKLLEEARDLLREEELYIGGAWDREITQTIVRLQRILN